MRKYTVRSVDLAAGTLDIDFVLHADAGPGHHGVHLRDDARTLDLGAQAFRDLVEIVELGREDQIVDIADDAMAEEVLRRRDRRHGVEIVA